MPVNDPLIAQINAVFNELKNKFTPNKTLMMAIAVHMRECVRSNILNEGSEAPINMGEGFASTNYWPKKKMFPGKALLNTRMLFRSIQATATDTEAITSTNRPGAALMHFGGEVKAKKRLGSVKRKKDVWAMEQYFWRRWYESNKKEKLFFILALHMQTHNSIYVPARPYMYLTQSFTDKIIDEIRKQVSSPQSR